MRPSQQEPFEIEIRKIIYDPKTDSEFEEITTCDKRRMPPNGEFPTQGYVGFNDVTVERRKITWIDKFLRRLFD